MNNRKFLFISIILMLLMITISSVSAGEIDTTEDLTISEELSIDNGDTINLDEELMEDNTILTDNEEFEEIQSDNSKEKEALSDSNSITVENKTFSGIQTAIDGADAGYTITLDGTYLNDGDTTINVTKQLNFVGINNATLDAGKLGGIFKIDTSGVSFKDITFKNGNHDKGAAIRWVYGYDGQLVNCSFENNSASINGGAIYIHEGHCTLVKCSFLNNSASDNGGAVYIYNEATSSVENCSFENNSASDNGGAISSDGEHDNIIRCSFFNNSASKGGAISIWNKNCSVVECSFSSNYASSEGDAIYVSVWRNHANIENCSFLINVSTANLEEDYCGAIFIDSSVGTNVSVQNCSFVLSDLIVNDKTFSALQIAINLASPGDTITLNGTYANNINRTVNVPKQLNFVGINNATLDAGKLSGIFNILADGVSFKDISFKNGKSSSYGGAILEDGISNSYNLSLVNCSFINNYASHGGGAICCDNLSIQDCSFINNSAENNKGGAICCGNVSVVNCSFVNNFAYSKGGAIYCDNLSVVDSSFVSNNLDHVGFGSSCGGAIYAMECSVFNCSFEKNYGENGGAIYSANGSVSQSRFMNNSARYKAGAIYSENASIANSSFADNYATGSSSMGGAIYGSSILNCTFVNNSASVGGAVYYDKNGSVLDSNFINNSASNYGGAITIKCPDGDENNFITLNCTFENNTAQLGGAVSFEGYGNISNCTFINNNATNGGALFNATAIDCTFKNNTANDGGALANGSAIDCTFTGNSAANSGGALYVSSASNCTFINNTAPTGGVATLSSFNNCTFINNTATNGGVGTSSNFYDCTFESNSATNGGAIFENNTADSYDVINCTFKNNSATNGGAIYLENTSSAIISNLSFEFNHAYDGGAIYTESCEDLSIENCSFTDNYAENNGGALDINKCTYSISNSNFTNNSAINMSGGAIWTNESGSIENCSFINNSAVWGGALRVDKSYILDCNFVNNTATGGGAITSSSQLTVENSNFTNNRAKNNGGAMDVSGAYNSILDCNFLNNSANYSGGALRLLHDANIVNCHFANNTAKDVGGAVFVNNKASINESSFVNNTAKNYGGAIQFTSGSAFNCTFINCSAQSVAGGAIRIQKGSIENCSFINCSSVVAGGVYANNNTNIIASSFVNCTASNVGGAVRMGTGSVKNCSFENCSAPNMGGALWVAESGSVEGSKFANNSATVVGGAIYINDVVDLYKISNCTFENNAVVNESAGGNRTGGAINCLAKNCEINSCTFNNNSAPDAGGALFVSDNNTSMYISNSRFTNNSVSGDFQGDNKGGGAIYSLSNGISIDRCNFISNTAEDSFGGALRLIYDNEVEGAIPPNVKKSNFHNNDAFRGGSVYTDGESVFILNGFIYATEDEKNKMVYGLSVEELEEYNTFTKSKLNSTIYPVNLTLVIGQDIVIPVSSDNVNTINMTILDANNQVVFSKEVLANDEVIVSKLTPGTYTVKYVANVDEDMFNPTSAQSILTINKAKSTVSASAVTAYYGKALSIKVNSKNATSIKYSIKNSAGTVVKSGSIASGASITGLNLAPGTYTLTLSTVVDENHTSSSSSVKITVKKSTAAITAKALSKYYAVTKKWSIKLMDKTNNKGIANQKITVRVYTGKKYKNYSVKTNAQGIATFTAPKGLTVGTHKVVLIYSHKYYNCKSLTSKIVVKKHPLNIRISFQQFTDGSRTVDIVVKSKVTNKAVNKMKLKVFIYTGTKVTKKYLKLVSGYYKFNKQNGFAMYGGGIKAFGKAGAHKIKVMPNDSRYSGASNIIKIKVPKSAKKIKTAVVSKGKYATLK